MQKTTQAGGMLSLLLLSLLCFNSCRVISSIRNSKKNYLVTITDTTAVHTIPFRMDGNRMIVSVKIGRDNPVVADLLLDTGAPTMLSTKFAAKYNIQLSDSNTQTVSTPTTGRTRMNRYYAQNINMDINGLTLVKKHLIVFKFENNLASCSHVDGILGIDILSNFNILMDFEKKEMVLFDKGLQPADLNSYPFKFRFHKYSLVTRSPKVTMTILGERQHYTWDAGYNGNIMTQFSSRKRLDRWAAKHPTAVKFETEGAMVSLAGKSDVQDIYFLPVGGLLISKEKVPLPKSDATYAYNSHLKTPHGNVGMGFMRNFTVFINWSSRKIYLNPGKHLSTHHEGRPDIGINYDRIKQKTFVVAINPDCAAYKNGLRAGDVVTKINDETIADIAGNSDDCLINGILFKKLKGASSITTIRGGKVNIKDQ